MPANKQRFSILKRSSFACMRATFSPSLLSWGAPIRGEWGGGGGGGEGGGPDPSRSASGSAPASFPVLHHTMIKG